MKIGDKVIYKAQIELTEKGFEAISYSNRRIPLFLLDKLNKAMYRVINEANKEITREESDGSKEDPKEELKAGPTEDRAVYTPSVKMRVLSIVQSEYEMEATQQSVFGKTFYFDSLDAIEFVMSLEKEFGISIPDGDISSFGSNTTVRDVSDYISRRLEEKG